MKGGWVYIMTNGRNGTLYTGVTAQLRARVHQHRTGVGGAFTRRYGLKLLVYAERHETIEEAIYREKIIKRWPRARKVRMIEAANPEWADLYDTLG